MRGKNLYWISHYVFNWFHYISHRWAFDESVLICSSLTNHHTRWQWNKKHGHYVNCTVSEYTFFAAKNLSRGTVAKRNAGKKYTFAECVSGREKTFLKTQLRAGLFKWTQIYTPLCFECNLYVDTLSLLCVLTFTSFALHLLTTERYTQYTCSQKEAKEKSTKTISSEANSCSISWCRRVGTHKTSTAFLLIQQYIGFFFARHCHSQMWYTRQNACVHYYFRVSDDRNEGTYFGRKRKQQHCVRCHYWRRAHSIWLVAVLANRISWYTHTWLMMVLSSHTIHPDFNVCVLCLCILQRTLCVYKVTMNQHLHINFSWAPFTGTQQQAQCQIRTHWFCANTWRLQHSVTSTKISDGTLSTRQCVCVCAKAKWKRKSKNGCPEIQADAPARFYNKQKYNAYLRFVCTTNDYINKCVCGRAFCCTILLMPQPRF